MELGLPIKPSWLKYAHWNGARATYQTILVGKKSIIVLIEMEPGLATYQTILVKKKQHHCAHWNGAMVTYQTILVEICLLKWSQGHQSKPSWWENTASFCSLKWSQGYLSNHPGWKKIIVLIEMEPGPPINHDESRFLQMADLACTSGLLIIKL